MVRFTGGQSTAEDPEGVGVTGEVVTQSDVDEEWCEECFPPELDLDSFCWECVDEHGEVDR